MNVPQWLNSDNPQFILTLLVYWLEKWINEKKLNYVTVEIRVTVSDQKEINWAFDKQGRWTDGRTTDFRPWFTEVVKDGRFLKIYWPPTNSWSGTRAWKNFGLVTTPLCQSEAVFGQENVWKLLTPPTTKLKKGTGFKKQGRNDRFIRRPSGFPNKSDSSHSL